MGRGARIGLGLALVAAVAGWIGPAAAAGRGGAAPAAASVESDFDGDGFADLAVGVSGDTVGTALSAGSVTVLYGTAGGPGTSHVQSWSAASPGVKGLAVVGGHFGASVAAGDFDGDGFADLAVGATGESVGDIADAGAVHVLYGSPTGLTADGNQRWTQNSTGVPGDAAEGEEFGRGLTVGNFGHGDQDDLAVSVDEVIGTIHQAGGVNVLYGTASGLRANGAQLWRQDTPGVPSAPGEEEFFGQATLAASLGKGPEDELVIGTPQDRIGGISDAGSATVLFGSSIGLTAAGRQFITEDTLGTPVDTGDSFGSALAAGNFGNGAAVDVAIGAPGAAVTGVDAAGAVYVAFGSGAGLDVAGAQRWTQAATGTGATEGGDEFGDTLAAGKFGRSGQADLAIGVPFEDIQTAGGNQANAGSVTVLYGSTSGLTSSGAQGFIQSNIGVGAAVEPGDLFGFELEVLPLGDGSQDDLAFGDAFEDIGDVQDSGAVFVLFGSSTGLTTADAQSWNPSSAGVPGTTVTAGRFGASVD